MVTYQEFWDALFKENYDRLKYPFTPFHRHIRETYTLYKRINQQDIRIKELEDRMDKMSDYIIEKLHELEKE